MSPLNLLNDRRLGNFTLVVWIPTTCDDEQGGPLTVGTGNDVLALLYSTEMYFLESSSKSSSGLRGSLSLGLPYICSYQSHLVFINHIAGLTIFNS